MYHLLCSVYAPTGAGRASSSSERRSSFQYSSYADKQTPTKFESSPLKDLSPPPPIESIVDHVYGRGEPGSNILLSPEKSSSSIYGSVSTPVPSNNALVPLSGRPTDQHNLLSSSLGAGVTPSHDSYGTPARSPLGPSAMAIDTPADNRQPSWRRTGDVASADQRWITVFGFNAKDELIVRQQLAICGNIVRYVPGPSGSNWMHLRFESAIQAQAALGKNGELIGGATMIGVMPCRDQEVLRDAASSSSGIAVTPLPPSAIFRPTARDYEVERTDTPVAPKPRSSIWNTVLDYAFGM